MAHISIVTPVYGCESCLYELYFRLTKTLENISSDFEIVMVNDSSPDNSWNIIVELANRDNRIKGINLSRNFGQHNAITAGLDFCNGEWVVVMDCDLQDVPEEIINLYNAAQENSFDVVFAKRKYRKDSFLKRKSSIFFYSIFNYFTGNQNDGSIANFSIIKWKVVLAFRQMKEKNRDYTFFVNWLGYYSGTIDVDHSQRFSGRTSYNLRKLITLGFDNIIANTNKPLYISIKLGFLISIFSFLAGIFLIIARINNLFTVEGWTSVIVSIWLVGGLLMMLIGTTGIYIGKIFDETKARPNYIIESQINL